MMLMQEILRIELVEVVTRAVENDLLIGQQKGKTFYLLVHNLNAGDPNRGVEILGENGFL